jgi:hypothetical protein
LGADPANVRRFVDLWDARLISPDWLLWQLQCVWNERQADADAVQEIISEVPVAD